MRKSWTTDLFIKEATSTHNGRYDYSKSKLVTKKSKIIITCKIHGDFIQNAESHLNGSGCSSCSQNKYLTTEEFRSLAAKIHKNKYDYSLSEYGNNGDSKVTIKCSKHGLFKQSARAHLRGQGCMLCCGTPKTTQTDFIKKADKIHSQKYNYDKVAYVNDATKVTIVCPKHGEFEQQPNKHLAKRGCPTCRSSRNETVIREYLTDQSIDFREQFKFLDCKYKNLLPFDFAIYYKNSLVGLIEFNGAQHYITCAFGSKKSETENQKRFLDIKTRDNIKNEYCLSHNIPLLIIPYWEEKNIQNIIHKFISKGNQYEN